MSWATNAYAAIRKIVLLEDRMENLTHQVDDLATSFTDLDRRLGEDDLLCGRYVLLRRGRKSYHLLRFA